MDIILGILLGGFAYASIVWLYQPPLQTLIISSVIYLMHVFFLSKEFIAGKDTLVIRGPIYFFRSTPIISYFDIMSARFKFWDGSGGMRSATFTLRNGKEISIYHSIRRKRITPILRVLYEHKIPIVIHDPHNDDLLKQIH